MIDLGVVWLASATRRTWVPGGVGLTLLRGEGAS
jgi:hypothetical protein